jgi:hypothetical protein
MYRKEVAVMTDELSELLRTLQAAKEILKAEDDEKKKSSSAPTAEKPATTWTGGPEPERKVSLGDVAKATHDYEREPLDRK